MKIIVNEIPYIPGLCLFSHFDRLYGDVCQLDDKPCIDTLDCQKLKLEADRE